jgi:hypothetical protein
MKQAWLCYRFYYDTNEPPVIVFTDPAEEDWHNYTKVVPIAFVILEKFDPESP